MSSNQPHKPARRPRRSNEQRSAETRSRLIEAAIDVLYRLGHSAATTIIIAKRARVSRGAMLHQFRTRDQLLVAVARHILSEQRRMRIEQLQGKEAGLPRFYAAADVAWAVQRHAISIALLELLMASRSDAKLRRGLEPFLQEMPEMRERAAALMGKELGIENLALLQRFLRLHGAALRGLAFETTFTGDIKGLEEARALFWQYERSFIEGLMAKSEKPAPPSAELSKLAS
jgi:AcrR family transcriptional regulator